MKAAPFVRLLLAIGVAASCARLALASRMDAAGIFREARNFLDPHKFKVVHSAYAAPDGTVWILGVDWNYGGREKWYAKRLDSDGERLTGDMELRFPDPEPYAWPIMGNPVPIGALPDGSLVLDIDDGVTYKYLAKIRPGGVTEATRVSRHFLGQPFVDGDGLVHIPGASLSRIDYEQVDMMASGLPVLRSLGYDRPADGLARAGEHLKWASGNRLKQFELTFFADGPGRILVATPVRGPNGYSFNLYRIETSTLAALDSGRIDLSQDVYRSWAGPTIPGTIIVPAGQSGYWLFAPVAESTKATTVVAYRFQSNLKVVRPKAVEADAERHFDAAPADAVVTIACPNLPRKRLEGGKTKIRMELGFTAFSKDGRLYTQAYQDSITSTLK